MRNGNKCDGIFLMGWVSQERRPGTKAGKTQDK